MTAASTDQLAELASLAAQHAQVEARIRAILRQLMPEGRKGDVDVAELARVLGVTRQTVYRWARTSDGGRVDVADVLDQALTAMLELVPHSTASQLMAGLSSSQIDVKVRRYRLGTTNLRGPIPEDMRPTFHVAGLVAAAAEDQFRRHGQWPRTVTLDIE